MIKMVIYKATNTINGKFYIGKTKQPLEKRKYAHNYNATKDEKCRGYKSKFYNAIRKYGFDSFKWEIIDEDNDYERLGEKEIFHIEALGAIKNGYNISKGGKGGDNFTNHPKKEEIREKISKSLTGRKMSKEFCKNNKERQIGQKVSKETKAKISKANKGRVITPEWKKKISDSLKGRKRDKCSVEKSAKALRGRKYSEEHKRKISEAQKGKTHSEKTKAKISKKMKGRIITPEWKEKIRQGNLKYRSDKAKRDENENNSTGN